ncbi:MAG: hypothetical protein JW892_15995 [Anaerolineae bacterium]|nr:hypothetical protein [Anaerolineae bacterium]
MHDSVIPFRECGAPVFAALPVSAPGGLTLLKSSADCGASHLVALRRQPRYDCRALLAYRGPSCEAHSLNQNGRGRQQPIRRW